MTSEAGEDDDRCRPRDLGLGGVQLELIGMHPLVDVIETINDDLLQLQ